jgi:transposase-like protein
MTRLISGHRGQSRVTEPVADQGTCRSGPGPIRPSKPLSGFTTVQGFWNALREVFPQARDGRCWFHKTANVLAALPKSAHPGAKKALAEIWGAEDKAHALASVNPFCDAYGAKFPKATAKTTDDQAELLAFYDYPAEHWVHLRTTNPI